MLIRAATALGATIALVAAASANPVRTDNVEASLLAEHSTLVAGSETSLLLKIDIRDGWHTYWRNPGDSGEATRIDWTLPDGVAVGDIQWPAPSAIPFGGFVNFGYEGVAYHLVAVRVDESALIGAPLELVARATWLVCEEICIPESGEFSITLPVHGGPSPRANPSAAQDFRAARAALPRTERELEASLGDGVLQLSLKSLPEVQAPFFFPYEWGLVEPSATQTIADGDDGAVLRMATGAAPAQAALAGVIVDRAQSGVAWRVRGRAAGPAIDADGVTASMGIFTALMFAFVGGLILNLMPCVFPVLSMKALHLVGEHVDGNTRRREGLAYTGGVLVFFALLGTILIVLRQSGQAIGWGFQLQSPPVVGFLSLLMFLIGLNLLGAFDIGGRFTGVGSSLAARRGTAGAFFTGALAAVVATPCTAPFMGAALGFAFTQSAPVALSILLILGLGLAFPFLLIAFVPGVARLLPRPGAWMDTMKQLLAFPMFGAAVWLAWVLSIQAGADGTLRLLTGFLLASMAVWVFARAGWGRAAFAGGALLMLASVATVLSSTGGDGPLPSRSAGAQAFSVERIEQARASGKTVFVNQTAAWCLTCLVNEKNVLATDSVQRVLDSESVVYLKGDWTRRDPDITAFLAEHGRSGVPLYVVYRGQEPANVLPPILTESIVLEALAAPN